MFRLTAYDDQPELYRYLSSIASNSICRALDDWFGTPYELEEVYLDYFTSRIGVNRRTDFFNGMEKYLHSDESGRPYAEKFSAWLAEWNFKEDYSPDDMAGMEFFWRKAERMKEKMRDPENYYTFDLFEEYLFFKLIDHKIVMETIVEESCEDSFPVSGLFGSSSSEEDMSDSNSPDSEASAQEITEAFGSYLEDMVSTLKQIADKGNAIAETQEKLISEYGFDEEDAAWTAEAVHRVSRMSMDDAEEAGYESLFFWDDDCLLFFDGAEYFIDSIHQIASGAGAAMGYGYEDVTKIFTDAGYQLPLWLVGTKAAYDTREESLRERLKDLQEQIYPEQDPPKPE